MAKIGKEAEIDLDFSLKEQLMLNGFSVFDPEQHHLQEGIVRQVQVVANKPNDFVLTGNGYSPLCPIPVIYKKFIDPEDGKTKEECRFFESFGKIDKKQQFLLAKYILEFLENKDRSNLKIDPGLSDASRGLIEANRLLSIFQKNRSSKAKATSQ